jgi:hypothetical protein
MPGATRLRSEGPTGEGRLRSGLLAWALVVVATLGRLVLQMHLNAWIVWPSSHDDQLLLRYADLSAHFSDRNSTALAKNMSYSLFLSAAAHAGIAYRLALFLLWDLAAGAVALATRSLGASRRVIVASYLLVLFCPAGLGGMAGLRLYRNSIIAPSTLVLLACLVLLATSARRDPGGRSPMCWSLVAGVWLCFDYYITESSVWMLPIVLASATYVVGCAVAMYWKQWVRLLLALVPAALPLAVLAGGTAAYSAVNDHYYGVYAVNTRTHGPFAEFMDIAYRVDDAEQWSSGVWVTASAWREIWAASPTLQAHPELLTALLQSGWASGSWDAHPPLGDLAAWAWRDVLAKAGYYRSESTVERLLASAVADLHAAQRRGTLSVSSKYFLSSGAPGRSWSEMRSLVPLVVSGLNSDLFDTGLGVVDRPCPVALCQSSARQASGETIPVSDASPSTSRRRWDRIGDDVILVARWISYGTAALALAGFICCTARVLRRRPDRSVDLFLAGSVGVLVASGVALVVGVAWFISWAFLGHPERIQPVMAFYSVGSTACFLMAEVLAIVGLERAVDCSLRERRSPR